MLSLDELFFLFTLRYIPNTDHEIDPPADIPEIMPHKINITLSSGIDSHYLLHALSLMPSFRPSNFEAICVDFIDSKDEPESVKAKEIAEKYGVDLVTVKIDDPLEDLQKLIEVVKEPRWNLYQYYLYDEVNHRTGCVITGDGADELYCGYNFRYKNYLDKVQFCKTWEQRAAVYLECHRNDWVTDQEELFTGKFDWGLILNYLKQFFADPFFDDAADKLGDVTMRLAPVLLADINGKLRYDYIPSNSRLASHCNIQLITPFLVKHEFDKSLKEYRINQKYNYEEDIGKIPLRYLINRMVDREKRGFGFDLVKYWTRIGFDRVANKLNKDSLCFEYINRDWYNQHLSDVSVPYITKYLQIYSLELYLELVEKDKICQTTKVVN